MAQEVITIVLAIFLNLSLLSQVKSCDSHKEQNVQSTLKILKNDKVPNGIWGGQHISLIVRDNNSRLEFDCASGVIQQPLTLSEQKRFSVQGYYKAQKGGAVIPDGEFEELNNQNVSSSTQQVTEKDEATVLYEGHIQGKTMTLKVTFIKTKEVIGNFSLVKGTEPQLTKCY